MKPVLSCSFIHRKSIFDWYARNQVFPSMAEPLQGFFKLAMGFTFTNYSQRIRIEKSKELLLSSDFTISRIAFLTGFNTVSFFNRTFKNL